MKCKHDKFLDDYYEVIGKLDIDSNSKHWLSTELFLYLHNQDTYYEKQIEHCNCEVKK